MKLSLATAATAGLLLATAACGGQVEPTSDLSAPAIRKHTLSAEFRRDEGFEHGWLSETCAEALGGGTLVWGGCDTSDGEILPSHTHDPARWECDVAVGNTGSSVLTLTIACAQ